MSRATELAITSSLAGMNFANAIQVFFSEDHLSGSGFVIGLFSLGVSIWMAYLAYDYWISLRGFECR